MTNFKKINEMMFRGKKNLLDEIISMNMKICFYLIFVLVLNSSDCLSQSGWFWQNPVPTGNDLKKTKFVNDSIGYGVGWGGTIIKTTNGGINWFSADNEIRQLIGRGILSSICFINNDTGFVGGTGILKTINGGMNWALQSQNNADEIFFINVYTGYAINNSLIKTTNQGINWFSVPLQNNYLSSMHFPSSETGYIGSRDGSIFKTINGGIDWNIVNTITNTSLLVMHFFNNDIGFVSNERKIFRTTDGGLHWQDLGLNLSNGRFYSIFFINEITGFAVTTTGRIYKTLDGGSNWTYDYLGGSFLDVEFKNPATGYIVGVGGKIMQTTDAGSHWVTISSLIGSNYLNAIQFASDSVGYIVQNGGIVLKTTNYGMNWFMSTNSLGSSEFKCLYFSNETTGYVSGQPSTIYKTTNGGNSWDSLAGPGIDRIESMFFPNQNTGIVCGGTQIFKTSDAGISWILKNSSPMYIGRLRFINDSTGFALYRIQTSCPPVCPAFKYSVILKTTDYGDTWSVYSSIDNSYFNDFRIINFNTWFAIENDWIWKSTNNGINWNKVFNKGGKTVFFTDDNTGYCAEYKTTNGGLNWGYQEVPNMAGSLIQDISFINSQTGFLVGGYGSNIIKTTNGGGNFITYIVNESMNRIEKFNLSQNFPNPFNPITKISFNLSEDSKIKLIVYDLLGREMIRIVNNEFKTAGRYTLEFDGSNFASGIYFYTLQTEAFSETKRMVLLK